MGSGGEWYRRRYGGLFHQSFQVLNRGGQQELVPGPGYSAQPEPCHGQMAFRFAKQPLDLLSFRAAPASVKPARRAEWLRRRRPFCGDGHEPLDGPRS